MPLANTIRWLRFNQGEMTQKELVDFDRVSRQTKHATESNKVSPSLVVAFKIAYTFGHRSKRYFITKRTKVIPKTLLTLQSKLATSRLAAFSPRSPSSFRKPPPHSGGALISDA